jgi:predicted transcriptional regulator
MPYQLPADLEHEFAARVTGHYGSIEQVLRQALSALDYRNQEIAAIQAGIVAMEQGRVMPLTDFDRAFQAGRGIDYDK